MSLQYAKEWAMERRAFLIEARCEGHDIYDAELRCFKQGFCHEDFYDSRELEFGDLRIHVWLADCRWRGPFGHLWQELSSIVGEQYAELEPRGWWSNKGIGAMRYASGRKLYWKLCPCGNPSNYEWTESLPGGVRSTVGDYSYCFCSWPCYAKASGLTCSECGGPLDFRRHGNDEGNHFNRDFQLAWHNLLSFGVTLETLKTVQFTSIYKSRYCSRKCCSLALERIKAIEREERKLRKEKKCVQNVKKLLSQARRSLQRPDPEAWRTLKREFAREAISQE